MMTLWWRWQSLSIVYQQAFITSNNRTQMDISNNGIELIKGFEGCRLTAYKANPNERHYTIGFGHYSPDINPNDTITGEQADDLLRADLTRFVAGVRDMVTGTLNQHQFDALVSFAFNVGLGNLKSSTLLKRVNANPNDPNIKQEFLRWVYCGKTKLKGLERRRIAEADYYFKKN